MRQFSKNRMFLQNLSILDFKQPFLGTISEVMDLNWKIMRNVIV